MPRLSDLELDRIYLYAAGDDRVKDIKGASFCTRPGDVLELVDQVRQLRDLIARSHPYLDAMAAPQELQDGLAAEVREIAADRLARAHADKHGQS